MTTAAQDSVGFVAPARAGRSSQRFFFGNLALIFVCVIGVADWLSAETQRLYVDDHSDASKQSGSVWQNFAIRGSRVVPQIILRDDAHLVFPVDLRVPHRLLCDVKPKGKATLEFFSVRNGNRELLIVVDPKKTKKISIALPHGRSELELVDHGALELFDLRLVRPIFLWPIYVAAGLALVFTAGSAIMARKRHVAEWATLVIVVLLSLGATEALLGKFRLQLPGVIIAARAELGLIGNDARWIDPARYKMRLKPNLETFAEWRHGDIARLGFIPKDASRASVHRFPIRTDAEGFRNATVREKIDVAALGDSFTDGTTSAVEETWPARLEQLTGRAVQNYGTSGFGPQQELYVLQDFALRHKPRWALLAFFAGNDLHDAEVFEEWERGQHRLGEGLTGPKLIASFRRYETLYLWTILRVETESIAARLHGGSVEAKSAAPPSDQPRFDRGMFTVPLNGRTLQFAFLPPYLQKLGTPRAVIAATRGWEITRKALLQMKLECEANGTTFVLMFVPSKDQVYWPLVERTFPPGKVQEAIDFYCRYNNMPLRAEDVRAHRLDGNELLRDFCAENKIPMVDLTPALQGEVDAGREVFFPDDTHWNEAGHEIAAREVAKFLQLAP